MIRRYISTYGASGNGATERSGADLGVEYLGVPGDGAVRLGAALGVDDRHLGGLENGRENGQDLLRHRAPSGKYYFTGVDFALRGQLHGGDVVVEDQGSLQPQHGDVVLGNATGEIQ